MHVVKPFRLSVLFRPFEVKKQCFLSAAVLAAHKLDGSIVGEAELWRAITKNIGRDMPLDLAMPKPRGEVIGLCRAYPRSAPQPACTVRFECGAIKKVLKVTGDRHFLATGFTDPIPFSDLPIDWQHAYGGPTFPKNPKGKGHDEIDGVRHMPNVEDELLAMKAPSDKLEPSSLLPYELTWPQRMRGLGTYDKKWLKHYFPGPPDDFDWSHYNAAPDDQRMEDFFAGGEAFLFENLHPERGLIEGVVPAWVGRVFVRKKGETTLTEMVTKIETVFFVPHEDLLVVLHRGTLPIAKSDGSDVTHILAALDAKDAPKARDHYQRVLEERLDRARAHLFVFRDRDLLPDGLAVDDRFPTMAESYPGRDGLLEQNQQRGAAVQLAELRERLKASGVDPDEHGVPTQLPPFEEVRSPEELGLRITHADQETEKLVAQATAERELAESQLRESCTKAGLDYEETVAKARASQGGPPTFSKAAELQRLEEMRTLARNAGTTLPDVERNLNDPSFGERLTRLEEMLVEAYQKSGHFFPEPARDTPQLREDFLARLATPGALWRADFTCVDLRGADLSGAALDEVFLEKANLEKAKLCGASLSKAVLIRARCVETDFTEAKLPLANLGAAEITNATFRRADLSGATLARARLRDTDLGQANLTKVDLLETSLENVSFDAAIAVDTVFVRCDFTKTSMKGADLSRALFIECRLDGVDLSGANLTSAALIGSPATGARFDDADLTNTRFVGDTVLDQASFKRCNGKGANFRGVSMKGADLSLGSWVGADFSAADLTGAQAFRANAKDARFDGSNLTSAVLLSTNLMMASFRQAILNGADLRDTNLFQVDFFRVERDEKTTVFGALTKRTYFYDWRPT